MIINLSLMHAATSLVVLYAGRPITLLSKEGGGVYIEREQS